MIDNNKIIFHLGKRKLVYEYHSEEGHIYLDDSAFNKLIKKFMDLKLLYDTDKKEEGKENDSN